jgi:hypothetical protein
LANRDHLDVFTEELEQRSGSSRRFQRVTSVVHRLIAVAMKDLFI